MLPVYTEQPRMADQHIPTTTTVYLVQNALEEPLLLLFINPTDSRQI